MYIRPANRTMTGLLCLTMMMVPSVSQAKKKITNPPMTPLEQTCHAWGNLTQAIAQDRDNGVSLVMELASLRQGFFRSNGGIKEVRIGTGLVYGVYARPEISPSQSRQAFELGCMASSSPMGE